MADYLTIEGISVTYGDFVALPPLSLNIRAGEFFCLLGPSGCGKSTTLNVVAGFIGVSQGRVLLDGADITTLPPQKREIGVVFQSYALFPHMTAAENIGYGLKMRKVASAEIAARVKSALSLVRLDGKGDRFPKQLSGGEQQRVAIARALAIEPRLLLLDEPLSNLDARLREEMRLELKRIQRTTGVTTIFVTHDQEEAFGAADRIAVLNKGVVEQVGTPVEIYRRPASPFVAGFIGRSNRIGGTYDHAGGTFNVGDYRFPVEAGAPGRPSDAATLHLRPEDLKLEASATVPEALRGRIASVSFGGATVDYLVETQVGHLEVKRLATETTLDVGETVFVSWPKSSGVVLASEGGGG